MPVSIRSLTDERRLEIGWPEGEVARLPFRFLRGRCPCAACVDEFTGRRIVDVSDIPERIAPVRLEYSGNYALKIAWNDGHETGLYTWDYLGSLGREAANEGT
jgi:DUF971 family protein